jgi:hypothetical protein
MIKRKQNTKTISDQKETEHKDYQWSKGNRTQKLSMIKRKQNTKTLRVLFPFDHWESLCYVSLWSLRLFVFCFLLIIYSLCVMFPFKETEHKDYKWSKGNRTQSLSMIKRKQNKNTNNEHKETEHKDYQWSKGNITQRLSMCSVSVWSLRVFVLCFLVNIESLCVLFPFDHW